MNNVTTTCVNGLLKAGDLVISTPDDDYSCLIGRVININLLGTPEHSAETCNDTDSVHVNFMDMDYSEQRIKEIEAMFSDLYGQKKEFCECPLDDTIMAPCCLIRITDIDESLLSILLESGYDAACHCFRVLSEIKEQSKQEYASADEPSLEIKTHILEVIDRALALAGYKIMDGDKASIITRHSDSNTDFEIKASRIIP